MTTLHKWARFVSERFNPLQYSVMIMAFMGAHVALSPGAPFARTPLQTVLSLLPLILAVVMFFFHLRLFDEVKDLEWDAIHHPERPLPRGILSKTDALKAAFWLLAAEGVLFCFYGVWAFASFAFTAVYSLVMYKEFFLKPWLRAHLVAYAAVHTPVVILLSLSIFCALQDKPLVDLPARTVLFSCAGWFLFMIFEFSRKSFARTEEREGVSSYSKTFGPFGATALTWMMAVLGVGLLNEATSSRGVGLFYTSLIPLGAAAVAYARSNKRFAAKVYRTVAALFIILAYGIVISLGF